MVTYGTYHSQIGNEAFFTECKNKTIDELYSEGRAFNILTPKTKVSDQASNITTRIRLKNRIDCCGERLAKTDIFVGDQLCGQIQDNTVVNTWYEVTCNLFGEEVKLVTTQDVP